MEPITTIALAKKIADAAGFSDWIKEKLGDSFGEKTAEKIAAIAKVATDTATPEEALKHIQQDLEAAAEVRGLLIENEHQLKMASLEDRQSAREMYNTKNEMADKIAEQVIKQNHLVVALLLIGNGLVLYLVTDKAIALALGNLIGASISALWQERQQVIGFFFGSSLGSLLKNKFPINPRS